MNKPHIWVIAAFALLGLLSGPALLKAYDKVYDHDARISVLESRSATDHALLNSINDKLDKLMVQAAEQGAKLKNLELAE